MAANLFGDRYAGRRPAWHGLAREIFPEGEKLSLSDAFRRAGLDYEMKFAEVYAEVPTLFGTQRVAMPDKRAIIRDATADDPELRPIAVVSQSYGLVQNMDLAATVDILTDTWGVETVGALGSGETVFFTLNTGDFEIKGDPVKGFFLGTNKSDGTAALQLAFTPVRVVCQNTLTSGLAAAKAKTSITHHSNVSEDLDSRVRLLHNLQRTQFETIKTFERMAGAVLNMDQAQAVIKAAYPDPKKGKFLDYMEGVDLGSAPAALADKTSDAVRDFERLVERALEFRGAVTELYQKFNDEQPALANTPWAVWNSVVEFADYREGKGDPDVSTLWGSRFREKQAAMKAALYFAK